MLAFILTITLLTVPWFHADALARGSGSGHSSRGHSSSHQSYHSRSHAQATPGMQRDRHGRIKRSQAAKDHFKKTHPCPSTGKSSGSCPGFVIDHVVPLKRGGKDAPDNMQWQTKEAARARDKVE
jgi:5-methylcytosine-specific restriction endonuclease McrA